MSRPNRGVAPRPAKKGLSRIKIEVGTAVVKALKAATAIAVGEYKTAAVEGVEIFSAFSSKPLKAEEIAHGLISAALSSSVSTLLDQGIKDGLCDRTEISKISIEILVQEVFNISVDSGWVVDKEFFTTPQYSIFINNFKDRIQLLFERLGCSHQDSRSISRRFPIYFVSSLHEIWISSPEIHNLLKISVDSPFLGANEQEDAWLRHKIFIERQVEEPLYGTPYTLRQLYEPLYGIIEIESRRKVPPGAEKFRTIRQTAQAQARVQRIVDIEKELFGWIEGQGNCQSNIRVISGGPGSGKSSQTRMWAIKAADKGFRVLYIPIHLLIGVRSDINSVLEDYTRSLKFPRFPLDPLELDPSAPVTVVLDGLDEIAMEGKIAATAAAEFVQWIDRFEGRLNYLCAKGKPKVRFVLGGRDLVVQQCASTLSGVGQVVSLLSFLSHDISDQVRNPSAEKDIEPPADLPGLVTSKSDQRDAWWRRFSEVSGNSYSGLPEEFATLGMQDVTSQPLLNFLLAHRFGASHGDSAQISQLTNRVTLYENLLNDVFERRWDRGRNPGTENIRDVSQFIRVLEEIAVATWHAGTRGVSLKMIREYCRVSGLSEWLDDFESASKDGLTGFLVSFYFRQSQMGSGEATFEFTHKSFAEYLVVRRAVQALTDICDGMKPRGARLPVFTGPAALCIWMDLVGPGMLTDDLFPWIHGLVDKADDYSSLHLSAMKLFNLSFSGELQIASCTRYPASHSAQKTFVICSELFLMIIRSILSKKSGNKSRLILPNKNMFSVWLHNTLSIYAGEASRPTRPGIRAYLDNIEFISPAQSGEMATGDHPEYADVELHGLNLADADLSGWTCGRLELSQCTLHSV